ncbi:phytoene desaturase [Lishizhenia tianjinensis]|uniref:Phytoene desaturase n=1 Tax=Lishizhenia tianjinensis TaxID=477690 RepID=A0A1I6XT79_9FLAO|nr:1-hydroxycarotenoid 3,4-desaturase CrtD [Lishizhenia tianjinensis]SFT41252.1 phytoene desaturase [Lishizhenia tianjinensis]
MKKAIVIGSGIGGLAAAVRLAKIGCSVDLFEANPFIGGKINNKQMGEYRFDTGPSVFTAPNYIEDLYAFANKPCQLPYKKIGEGFRYFYPDGTRFTLPNSREEQVNLLSEKLGENPVTLNQYLDKAARNYKLIAPLFIEKSLHNFKSLLGWKLVKALLNIRQYALSETMHSENKNFFFNPKTLQFFNRFATYNGSDPYKAPAMLNMISHLEVNEGIYLPEKGMQQISSALGKLCKDLGVKFHLNEKVEEIELNGKDISGIRTKNGLYSADIIVSNMDINFTYEKLMPKVKIPRNILKQEKSSSAVVFYWGIKKEFPELGLHNVFFNSDYRDEFNTIFDDKQIYFDPSIYINITSKEVPGDAPKGCENWFVMVNVPHNVGQDWKEAIPTLRNIIISRLNKELKVDLNTLIEVEDVMSPVSIEKDYFGKMGAIYGNASNNKFAAFYRHSNKHKSIKGLYFAGVSVHPGGGIPLALNAAKLAVEYAKKDFKL